MKRLLLGIFPLLPFFAWAQVEKEGVGAAEHRFAGKVVLVTIGEDDLGEESRFQFWKRALQEASEGKARAVVFELDTPGGLAYETKDLMTTIANLEMRTIAYVKGDAISAGAMLALATDSIYMGKDSIIGAAGLVVGNNEEAVIRKRESIYEAHLRGIVTRKGHDYDVGYAMMIPAAEDTVIGKITVKKGALLTLTAQEAISTVNGKPLLARGIVTSLEDILEKEGLQGVEVVPAKTAAARTKVLPPAERPGVTRTEKEEEGSAKTKDEESFEGKIVVLGVGEDDLMNSQSFKFWRRMMRRAEDEKATAIVFDLDTPGGRAFETKDLMTELTRIKIPSFAYVNPNAISAGALVSVATDAIYMSPDGVIGAAGLVSGAGEIEEMMRKKLHSVFEAHIRSVAEKKGYDPELIRSMMIPDEKNERVFGEVVVKKGELLSLNSTEATSLRDGKPLLAKAVVNSIEELVALEGYEGVPIVRADPTPFERFAWWVAKWSFLLILIGMGAAYAEMKAPGFGIGGAISLTAFGIFFFGNYVAGNMAGYEMAALFVLGVILILVEIFLIPGTGLAGLAGVLCIVSSLLFGMVDEIEWKDWQVGDFSLLDVLRGPVLSLGAGLLGGSILIILLMRFLPNVPIFRALMVQQELVGGASLHEAGTPGHEDRVGWTGETLTDLRPSGKAKFAEDELDVIADGAFISRGEKVRVVEEDGMRVVVTQIEGI